MPVEQVYTTDPIIQHLALHLHTRHKRIFRQIILPAAVLLVRPPDLLVQRLDIGWEQPMQLECLSLFCRKCRALVECG